MSERSPTAHPASTGGLSLSGQQDPLPRVVTIVAVAFVVGLALLLIAPALMTLQADSFRDLYLGRWIAGHGIPHHEVFAIANRGRAATDQQWLADLFGYGVWRLAGYQGLAVLNALAVAVAYGLLTGAMRTRGASMAVAISFASFAMVSLFTLVFIRAQSLALPLFPALLWLCALDSQGDAPRWPAVLVVPVLVLWANLHGSVLLGAALAAGYLLARAYACARCGRRRGAPGYLALALLAALAPLATPYGTGILGYYRDFAGNSAVGAADLEWDPPMFGALSFFQFAVPLALAGFSALLAFWRARRRPALFDLWAVGLTVAAALLAMRNNVWLGMAAALLIADTAGGWLPTQPVRTTFLRAAALAAAVLAALGVARLASESAVRYQALAPEREIAAAARYAASHPCARVLADNLSVSALLWRDPALDGRVAFDGRIELYPERSLAAWVAFQAAAGPSALDLDRGFQLLLASRRSPALVLRLARLPHGAVLARDPRGITVINREAAGTGCASGSA